MAYQKNNNKKKDLPKNVSMSFDMYMGIVGNRIYSVEDLVEFLKDIPFTKISIPVKAPKSIVMGDDSKYGTTIVGYINNIDIEEDGVVFHTTIYAKNADAISDMECPVVYPKLRVTDKGDIQLITSFELDEAPEDEEE